MMDAEKKKKYIELLLEQNILVEPSKLADFTEADFEALLGKTADFEPELLPENKKEPEHQTHEANQVKRSSKVKVVFNYKDELKKREVKDFVEYYNKRFEKLRDMLKQRRELNNLTSINKLLTKKDRAEVSVIGIVLDIKQTKNGHYMLVLEDKTGTINVLVNKKREDLVELAKEIVLDEVIGINGTSSDKLIFSNSIILPDIIMNMEFKKSPDEAYAVFTSDIHIGAKKFLPDSIDKFLAWLNCEIGNDEQKAIASKVKYLFIAGDMVEGVGIFPEQEEELEVKDIYEQYRLFTDYIKLVPSRIQIILCPGNHDAVRLSEPQPIIPRELAPGLYNMQNVTQVTSPGIVNIHSSDKFSGFDVLLYHGTSFIYYADKVETLRTKGGIDRIDLVMKFLMQKRHLAPTHTSTLYVPDTRYDPLIIETIPDFFVTGHIHKVAVSNFRSTTLVSGSCWIEKTSYQEKLGIHPEPARVPVVNLQTREIKILRF
jgi:DNA polymerase II small subunit